MTATVKKSRRSLTAAPHIVWAILFIIAPLIFVAVYSFTASDGSFTFENFAALGDYTDAFVRSASYSLIATFICLLIGYPLAYAISNAAPKMQRILIMMVMLPMWINFLIRTYAIMKILEDTGIINTVLQAIFGEEFELHMINTPGAVIFGMVYDYLPYMVLPIYTVLQKLDPKLSEAAADLGCNKVQTLFKVTLPLSVSGIVSGITMVFVPSISTFYISQKLGGGQYLLIGDAIETAFGNTTTYNIGASMSLVLMIIVLLSTAIMNRFDKSENEGGAIV
ncbi:MAG: ABC transporter permease [Clostridia bacterium]|nr:ABC transporter permease [Clostridia bacterium]